MGEDNSSRPEDYVLVASCNVIVLDSLSCIRPPFLRQEISSPVFDRRVQHRVKRVKAEFQTVGNFSLYRIRADQSPDVMEARGTA
jgi:hypothetical protein